MKNQCFALLAMSLLSCAVHAKVTLEDVYRDSREMANAVQGVSEADALADWKNNGGLPNNGGKINWDDMPAGTRCGTSEVASS